MFRIGYSEDIHELVEGRKLILAGVVVPFEKGEKAHSDGDVVYHALGESLLGSLALGDLGTHFPDNSTSTLNMDSSIIVKEIMKMVKSKGYRVNNVDISLVLEKPKIAPYVMEMRKNIASLLEVELDQVSLKAGTNEKMDDVGQGKAVKAISVVIVSKE